MSPEQREAIRSWVADTLGVTVIYERSPAYADPTAPRPPKPYVSILVGNDTATTNVIRRMRKDGSGIRDLYQDHEVNVTLRFLGNDCWQAMDMARRLGMLAGSLDAELRFVQAGVALLREGVMLDSGVVRSAHWIGRVEHDLVFGYTYHLEEDPGIIEKASFDITVNEPTREFTVKVEVEP